MRDKVPSNAKKINTYVCIVFGFHNTLKLKTKFCY